MYNALNNGINPLKIVRVSDTHWLSIQVAICHILNQWEDLKDHFKIVGTQEHCHKAKTLYNMYSDHPFLEFKTEHLRTKYFKNHNLFFKPTTVVVGYIKQNKRVEEVDRLLMVPVQGHLLSFTIIL